MSAIEILAVIGIIGYVIFRQVQGEPLRGKRTVLLPAILTGIGLLNLHGSAGAHVTGTDVACIVAGTAGSAAIGLAFGAIMRLESRGGYLWAQLPLRGLWLWAGLAGWRVLVMVLASGLHAHIAASTATLLLSLGVNRLAQAAVVVMRATAMGVPFAPEKDGKVFMGETFKRGPGDRFGDGSHDDRLGFDGRGSQGTWGSQGGYGTQDRNGDFGGFSDGYGEHARRRAARRAHRARR